MFSSPDSNSRKPPQGDRADIIFDHKICHQLSVYNHPCSMVRPCQRKTYDRLSRGDVQISMYDVMVSAPPWRIKEKKKKKKSTRLMIAQIESNSEKGAVGVN